MKCTNCNQEFLEGFKGYETNDGTVCLECLETEYNSCENCGDYYLETELQVIDGKSLCQDCIDENLVECSDCGNMIDADETRITESGDIICESCYDENYFTCVDCGKIYHNNDMNVAHDNTYCDECFNENFTYCEDCGEVINNDYIMYHEGHDCYYCEECYPPENNGPITQYEKTIARIFGSMRGENPVIECHNSNKKLFLGVELEVECQNNDRGDIAERVIDIVHESTEFKEDGSLNNGFEIVTQPFTLDYHKKEYQWKALLEKLVSEGCKSHDVSSCGLHIHVNNSFLGKSQTGICVSQLKILKIFDRFWDELSNLSRRENLNYCQKNNKVKTINQLNYEKQGGRYYAVNISGYETTEFRLWRGTLKYNTLIATFQLTDSIVRYCVSHSVSECARVTWADLKDCCIKGNNELKTYLNERSL